MSQPNITPQQMQTLLQFASAKLGVPAEQLAGTVTSGGYDGLMRSLSPQNQQKLQQLLGDRTKAEALLNSPQVQQLLAKFNHTKS